MPFVVDASVSMAWCLADEKSEEGDRILDRLLDDVAHAPSLWLLEVTNVLLVAQRGGRATEAEADRALSLLRQLPIVINDVGSPDRLRGIGRLYNLSAYDSSYLALALDSGMALASFDAGLRSAAGKAGVAIVS